VRIGEVKVTDAYGNLLSEIALRQLRLIDPCKIIYYEDNGLEIVFPKTNLNPSVAMPLKDVLNFEDKLPFPIFRWLLSLMAEMVLCVLFAFVSIRVWKRLRNQAPIKDSFRV
jgi:hypothetical protein